MAAGLVVLATGVAAGCGGGSESSEQPAAATTAPSGTVTSRSTQGAEYVVNVTLSDGSKAEVGGYLPAIGSSSGSTRVQAKVGDLVAFLLPPAFSGREWKADGGTADGAIAELAGSGPATTTGQPDSDSFTYRATAAGEGTLKFVEEETAPDDGPPQPALVARFTLVVSE